MNSFWMWLVDRFLNAFSGLGFLLRDKSICLQLLIAGFVLIAGMIFSLSAQEWFWVLLAIFLVLIAEAFNTCIEKIVDYISLERNEKAGQIKDMAAGAVFLAALFAFIIGFLIFMPHLIIFLRIGRAQSGLVL